MIEKYFTLKLIGEAAIIGFFVLVIIILLVSAAVQDIRWNRKIKLLEKNGFVKYLRGVPSVGNGPSYYGWKRESDGKRIDDTYIKSRSYKELKKWIEEEK